MLESYIFRDFVINIDDETQYVMIDQTKNIVQSHHEMIRADISKHS